MRGRGGNARGLVTRAMAMALVVGAASTAADPVAAQTADVPDWFDDVEPATADDDPTARDQDPESVPAAESEGTEPADVTWPTDGSSTVTLGGDGETTAVRDGLVEIEPATDRVDGDRVQVEVLDRSVAERVGASGFLFELAGTTESVAEMAGSAELPTEIAIDYSGFEFAYGGGYADRLQLVALPS